MQMKSYKDNAEFLHLFSQDQNGLKYLTHDCAGLDFIDYVYRCQRIILSYHSEMDINAGLYDLVRGFVFGPSWTDYNGKVHSFYVSSEECIESFEKTGRLPMNNTAFEAEIENFRNSIRFRSGRLDLFVREELSTAFPSLNLQISGRLKGADMYVYTGPVRDALFLILKGMLEYSEYPHVVLSYFEDELDAGFLKSTISLTQVGSFPSHTLSRDMKRLSDGDGGTFGTIRKLLRGLCDWTVLSKWTDSDTPVRWRILGDETLPEVAPASAAEGFSHIISIYHKP